MTSPLPEAADHTPLLTANRRNALKLGLLGLTGLGAPAWPRARAALPTA